MDEIKRKISEEFDERGVGNFSAGLRAEIESSGDLKEYADDLLKVEGVLHSLRDAKVADPDWKALQESISQSIGKGGGIAHDALLAAPMPDGKEDQVMAGDEAKPTPVAAKSAPEAARKEEDRDAGRMRLTASKQPSDKKGESSGLINLGALVQEHRKSMVAPPPGSGLDVPPTLLGADRAPGAGRAKPGRFMPIAIGLGAVALIAIVAIVGVTKLRKPQDGVGQGTEEVDRKALEEKIKQEILAQLKAEGKIGAEAEAEAQKQAALLAKAEIEKSSAAPAEDAAGTGTSAHSKKKKKDSGAVGAAPAAGVAEPAKEAAPTTAKKGTTADSGTKKPATAEDDLLGLLEGAAAKKPAEGGVLSPGTPTKTQPAATTAPAPAPSPTPTSTAGLPKTLSKEDISKSMNKIKPKILGCGEGKIGTLMLSLVVNSDGTVKSAKVTGKFATDPAGVCAENVAKTAKFPPFSNPTASVTYPFVFAPKPGE